MPLKLTFFELISFEQKLQSYWKGSKVKNVEKKLNLFKSDEEKLSLFHIGTKSGNLIEASLVLHFNLRMYHFIGN